MKYKFIVRLVLSKEIVGKYKTLKEAENHAKKINDYNFKMKAEVIKK